MLDDIEAKGVRDLLCDAHAAELGIAAFHRDDWRNEWRGRTFGTGFAAMPGGGKEQAVFPIHQRLVELEQAYICDAIRTPFGRYGGALSSIRADDLGAIPLRALMERNQGVDWSQVDDVTFGCANQAGEDNRNVARMSALLAGLPEGVPGSTINRLCGSGMDAIGVAARAIKSGEAALMIAGGVESMSRAPFVQGKATTAFSRQAEIFDTTIGWRFVNPLMKKMYGVDSMPETGENVATDYKASREDQDAFAMRSQQKAARAQKDGSLAQEIVPVSIAQKKGDPVLVSQDEHRIALFLRD